MEGSEGKIGSEIDTKAIIIVSATIIVTLLIKWLYCSKPAPRTAEKPRPNKVIVRIWTSKANVRYPGDNFGHVSLELQMNGKPGSRKEFTYISVGPGEKLDCTNNVKMHNIFSKHPPKYTETYVDDLEYEERVPELTFQFHTLDADAMQLEFEKHLKEKKTCWSLCGIYSIGEAEDTMKERIINIVCYTILGFCEFFAKYFKIACVRDISISSVDNIQCNEPHLVSCVSLVNEILNAGCLYHKLVSRRDNIKSKLNSSNVSSEHSYKKSISGQNILANLTSIAYLIEHTASSLIISPDVLGDLLMYAKENEIEVLTESLKEPRDFTETLILKDGTEKTFSTKEWLPSAKECKGGFPTHLVSTLIAMVFTLYCSWTYNFYF